MPIHVENWFLDENGNLLAWIPHVTHTSSFYSTMRHCYTGQTKSSHQYTNSEDGITIVDGISIEYEYKIPLTQIKQRKVKWQWHGLYTDIVIEFNIEQHCQEYENIRPPMEKQSLKEINDIIAKLNIEKYFPHNFRVSEGMVLCQFCGEFLADIKKTNYLPGCNGMKG